MTMPNASLTLRALARLLSYPDAGLRTGLQALRSAIYEERALSLARIAEIDALACQLADQDPLETEARYVECFDQGRSASLHLFEHVHGDSRERGPAMLDLARTYAAAGLWLGDGELPDYLPVVLEFASTRPAAEARAFLGETTHILNAIFSALRKRGSPYASLVGAVIELAGETAQAVPLAAEPPLDESWAEPAAFGGCSVEGQARSGGGQPVRVVRTAPTSESRGAAR
jgi:nitrate reductase delta subunit